MAAIAILWNPGRGMWEAWRESRPIAESPQLDALRAAYPNALVGPRPA